MNAKLVLVDVGTDEAPHAPLRWAASGAVATGAALRALAVLGCAPRRAPGDDRARSRALRIARFSSGHLHALYGASTSPDVAAGLTGRAGPPWRCAAPSATPARSDHRHLDGQRRQ